MFVNRRVYHTREPGQEIHQNILLPYVDKGELTNEWSKAKPLESLQEKDSVEDTP